MTHDQWLVRLSIILGAIIAAVGAVRAVLRVARGTFRVFDVILGVGRPGDEEYRPSMATRLDLQDRVLEDLTLEVRRLTRLVDARP